MTSGDESNPNQKSEPPRADEDIGDWFRRLLGENAHFEQDEQILSRIRRVENALQGNRSLEDRKVVEVPWLDELTAFTLAGRYIYISRRLYQLFSTDEEVAFVVAHELAHHDLGHLDIFRGWAESAKDTPGAGALAVVLKILGNRIYSVEHECEADRHALRLCEQAGYKPEACVASFDILEEHALNLGDIDAVYGPDELNDGELSNDASWTTQLRIWSWLKLRGYLPIRDRRQALFDSINKDSGDLQQASLP